MRERWPRATRDSPARIWPALGRASGYLVSSLAMISVSGPTYSTGLASPCTTADAVASAEPAWKGGSPSVAKYSSAPSDHRSVGGPTSTPWACSGDMYDGDPTISPVAVSRDSSRLVATPQSRRVAPA